MELLFSLKTGAFPLYVPGFASGHSASALTLGQFFHPLSHIASIMPGYWDGLAVEWNTFVKLLSIGFAQLAIFAFLRKIRLSGLISFLLSLIVVYNLRLVDLFRYGASLEAYTAHLVLCAALGWYYINPTKLLGPLCIIGVTYMLVCSGHPQMMYYGLVGAGLFVLVAPFFLSTMLPDKQVDFKIAFRFWLKAGLYLSLGIMLSSAYILPFYFDFIAENVDRVNQSYSWTGRNLDTFAGSASNFFLPLRSAANGAFGGSSLIIIPAMLPVLRIFKIKIPRPVWIIWGFLLFMFLYMQGSRTPIHKLVWQYVPFASSIRIPGRISMIMPFFMMLLMAWVIKADSLSDLPKKLKPSVVLALFAVLLITIYYLLNAGLSSFGVELLISMLGIVALIAMAFYGLRDNSTKLLGVCLVLVTILQLGIVLKYGSLKWIDKKYDSPTFIEMQAQKRNKLDYLYNPGVGLRSSIVKKQLKQSFVEPFAGKIFTRIIPVNSQDEAYIKMKQERLPQQLFIEEYDLEKARKITEGARHMREGLVKLVYSSFNRLQFHVSSEAPSIFGLSYPYTGNWKAWVNGKRVHVNRANGAAHAVEIPRGESLIEFRYWSNAFFWGIIISCTALAATGLFICFSALKGLKRIAGVIVVFTMAAGVFMLWYNSLYTGDNLETRYAWTYTPQLKIPNLAYGKKNWLGPSATSLPHMYQYREHELCSGRFVDGDRSPGSGFATVLSDNPAWFIDLYRIEKIESIILYESGQRPSVYVGPLDLVSSLQQSVSSNQGLLWYTRPLEIALSSDGNDWNIVTSVVSQEEQDGPLTMFFDKAKTARYIRITASGKTQLSLDEVEVYGPLDNDT